jgi:hypothetical protein
LQVSQIDPDEIPDVPKNRFLYRGVPESRDEPREDDGRRPARDVRKDERRPHDPRKRVKGRGAVVS